MTPARLVASMIERRDRLRRRRWYVRLRAGNGEIVMQSEGYNSAEAGRHLGRLLAGGITDAVNATDPPHAWPVIEIRDGALFVNRAAYGELRRQLGPGPHPPALRVWPKPRPVTELTDAELQEIAAGDAEHLETMRGIRGMIAEHGEPPWLSIPVVLEDGGRR